MAEYATGTTGRIYIEDAGDWIHIDIDARQGTTNIGTGGFSWSDPLGSGSGTYSYPAGSGRKRIKSLGPFGPGQGGTVYFTLNATGTQGLGGPTSVSFSFSRTTVPQAPTMLGIDQETHQTFRVRFTGNWDGGTPVREWQIHYSNNVSGGQYTIASTGTTTISVTPAMGFPPGSPVYAWARGRNDVGWGPFSGRGSGQLVPGVKLRVAGVWKDAVPYVRDAGVWKPAIPYVRKAGVWTTTQK